MNLTWNDLIIYILETLCGLVITFGIPYAISLIRTKIKSEQVARIIDRAGTIIEKSVTLVNQTFVDALKENGKFDRAAQKAAFDMCKQRVLSMLNEESIKAIYETFGDFDEWIRMQIEASVRTNKLLSDPIHGVVLNDSANNETVGE